MSKVEKLRVLFPKNFPRILVKMYKKHCFLTIFDHFYKIPKTGFSALIIIVTKKYKRIL